MIYRKKGQLMIFVIIAIVIVAGVIVYFLARGSFAISRVPADLKPVFDSYESCIEQETRNAIELAGSQGGYVDVSKLEYEPGSEHAPFSSELNFLGFPTPYWYYVSGNGLMRERVPSLEDIEQDIAEHVVARAENCNFDVFYEQGFIINNIRVEEVEVTVLDDKVNIDVISDLVVSRGESSARKNQHSISVNSKLGKFYEIARRIYGKERNELVFEGYGEDVLRLYAPVDGVEISCSGEVWKTREVVDGLKSGLEMNIASIKFMGNYYDKGESDKYYIVDIGDEIDENVNLIYSKDMPTKIEIVGEGVSEELMIAEPVGIQEGLGILGFCYAPYHFVYDLSFPVLVQIYNNDEVFQFPIVVVIENNVRGESGGELEGFEYLSEEEFDLCKFKTQDVEINVFDINLNPIDAKINYQCFNQRCELGETADGRFSGRAPSCLNGQLFLRSEGFADKIQEFSSNKESIADVILDREYEPEIELEIGGKALGDRTAIVSFVRKDGARSSSAALPDFSSVKLSEGDYDVRVYAYDDLDITIPASTKTECYELPRAGILGFFGSMKEECVDIKIPETKVENALIGGGRGSAYLLESELEDGKVVVSVDGLPVPRTLAELQYNYEAFELGRVSVA